MPEILIPRVPRDNRLRIRPAVVTGKYLPYVPVSVLFREGGTVDRRRVAATFRVDEELGLGDVPRHRAQRFRFELLERHLGVVDSDLMATKRRAGATFSATRPRAVLQALRVDVVGRDAGDRVRREVRQYRGYRRFDDERDQEEEAEDREDRRGAKTERRVELGLLYHGPDLGLLHLHPHDHR